MMVRAGYNSEYGRKKFDVELDEADLHSLIFEAGATVEDASRRLTTNVKFRILRDEAQRLALQGAIDGGLVPPSEVQSAQAQLAQMNELRAKNLAWMNPPKPQASA
jgi:hypothetical protein